jgi:hypothetical protein
LERYVLSRFDEEWEWSCLLGWWCVHSLGQIVTRDGYEAQSRSWIDEWLLGKVLGGVLQDLGLEEKLSWRGVALIKLATSHQRTLVSGEPDSTGKAYSVLNELLKDDEVQQFLGVNRYRDVLWFNKEALEDLLWWLLVAAVIKNRSQSGMSSAGAAELDAHATVRRLIAEAEASGYQLEDLLRRLQPGDPKASGQATKGKAVAAAKGKKGALRSNK